MIALVVPVFQHSILLFDAIQSLALTDQIAVIIVDDGCPNIETQFSGLGLAAIIPQITYLRGPNRGLSGARNRGIDYILAQMPDCKAIYFLDADNMLSDWSLTQMQAMLAAHDDYDWFYPDIRMFGLEWEATYAGAFSPLLESLVNICEAGSLVRRRMFESGLRFSETLRLGFEDWDFWLSAIEKGFRGLHFANSGFKYRKRPESMLANATRDQNQIRSRLEQRHPWMKDIKWAVAAEHETAPRYAIYLTDLNAVRLTSSAERTAEEISWPVYQTFFWAALRAPKTRHAGAMFLVTTSANLEALEAAKLLTWSLFDLEVRLRDCNIATIDLSRNTGQQLSIGAPSIGAAPPAVLAAISIQSLRAIAVDESDEWINSAATNEPQLRISNRAVHLPDKTPYGNPIGNMVAQLVRASCELRLSPYAADEGFSQEDAAVGTPDRAQINNLLRAKFGGGVLAPALNRRGPEIAFALPRFSFGGVEKVTLFVAKALRRRGYTVNLLLLKTLEILLPDEFGEAFNRVFFLDNQEFESWSGPNYLGTALSRWSVSGEQFNELNLLSIFDAVIACHAGDIMGLMGNLQRRGVVTGAYNHLFDLTETGRHCGHPHIALAFEHALDLFVCCSINIGLALHGHGVPAAKIVTVPNAAGITITAAAMKESLTQRAARQAEKLNILFLSRIDQQKGLDRLAAICSALRQGSTANIRIIGRPVISLTNEHTGLGEYIEEPVYGRDLINAYQWADILLLPSLYEGLPLTIIEAMQMGVVPIAARSGGVDEAIENGRNGFIVSQDDCVAETLAHIAALAADRPKLHEMMEAAAASPRNWDDAVDELDAALRRLLAKRAKALRSKPEMAALF